MSRFNFSQFSYRRLSPGHYEVTYVTKSLRTRYRCIVTDMSLIDAVFYDYEDPDEPRQCDMKKLYDYIKCNGYEISKTN